MSSAAALAVVAPAVTLAPECARDAAAVDALVAAAFGPGRYAKTAERVRERAVFRPDLSVCAWAFEDAAGGELVGAVRLWSVLVGETPALFLGPIAVAPHRRGRGVAAQLTARACERAAGAGERLVVLVGDPSRFEPMGFCAAPLGRVTLPGPVDPRRILWRAIGGGSLDAVSGPIGAPRT